MKEEWFSTAQKGKLAIAKLLRQRGADIHAKSENGKNALELAKNPWNKSEELINYLKSLELK